LGTIFRVTFTVFYRRIWNIVGKYSILCCDKNIKLTHRFHIPSNVAYTKWKEKKKKTLESSALLQLF
jgi:hypothetical protein